MTRIPRDQLARLVAELERDVAILERHTHRPLPVPPCNCADPEPAISCLSFAQQAFTSSTSWVVDLPDGVDGDFMFAYVMPTEVASATPTGWTEEQSAPFAFGGTRHYWWRKIRAGGETSFTINFGSASSGSVILVNAELDPALPGDSWGGAAYNDLSGDFAGVVEPWNFDSEFGPYDPTGSIFIMQVRHTGGETSTPASPWEFATYGTAGTATHQVFYWQGTGNVPDFTWDTTGSTRDITFIELAHVCTR